MISFLSNRRGKVIIKADIAEHEPETYKRIQDKLLIIQLTYDFYTNSYVILAINDTFDIVKEGEVVPAYWVQMDVVTGDIYFIREKLWDQSMPQSHKLTYNTSQKNLLSMFVLTLKNLMTASYHSLLKWCIKLKWKTDQAQRK